MSEHPEIDPDDLALEELELEDDELDAVLSQDGPEAELLRRLDEDEVVSLEGEDADEI